MLLDLEKLEKTLLLMDKYQLDEIQCEEFTLKKTRFKAPEPTPQELLEKHVRPVTLEDASLIASNRIAEVEAFLNPEKK